MEKCLNKQIAIIIRGVSGSGKTTLAKNIIKRFEEHGKLLVHCEADLFRINDKGEYHFDPSTKIECHNNCFNKFKNAVDNGLPVVVANCFIEIKDMLRYVDYLKSMNIEYVVVRTKNIYQNIHGLSDDTILDMKKKIEPFEEEISVSAFNKLIDEEMGFEH
jgi:tRNA uridine 5-carbamoylmethylation protein Kti12